MADCGEDFPYQLIEYAGTQDMRNSQLLRAEIDTINRSNNTASITLLDECVAVEELDLSAVEFWYHCETSTGTLEDLMNGHRAFLEEDIVYAVFIPGRGEAEERFYIIGHVDIRATKKCEVYECVILSTGYPEVGGVPRTCVTIFDVGTASVLDLDAFENIDELSPPKPSSFPCVRDSNFEDWFDYNFEVTPTASVPLLNSVVPQQDPVSYDEEANEIISQDDDCTDPRHTHTRRSFTFTQPGVYSVTDSYITQYGASKPYPWAPCLYAETVTVTESANGSGNEIMGWIFVDQDAAEFRVGLEIIEHVNTTQEGSPPVYTEFSVQFSAFFQYPFALDYLSGETSFKFFEHTYTSYSEPRYDWMVANISGVLDGVPQSTGAVSTSSNFEGLYGLYYASRFSFIGPMSIYSPRAFGFVSLKQDIGLINEENPLTLERFMRNIDIGRSQALAQSLVDLDNYLFDYLSGLSGTIGVLTLLEFPCHRKEN